MGLGYISIGNMGGVLAGRLVFEHPIFAHDKTNWLNYR